MRYRALAVDYDGTLATDGRVGPDGIQALERVRQSGRRALLVTGRQLDDLRQVFDRLDLFDRVVAENGAVLFDPASRETRDLADPPPAAFVDRLRGRGVEPISVGRVVVATREPHHTAALEAIRELGLGLHVIFNKGAVMVLPTDVDKRRGMLTALEDLRLSPHGVVAVGDAENDHPFLEASEFSVAVANALPAVRERVDHVTRGARTDGVVELVDRLVHDDLASLDSGVTRHDLVIGRHDDGTPVGIHPARCAVLVVGASGTGKSRTTMAFLEELATRGYQFCLVDPEGDHEVLEGAVVVGSADRAPEVPQVLELLEEQRGNVIVNLLGVRLEDRPAYLRQLVPGVQAVRDRLGRPEWLVLDEAHHVLPAEVASSPLPLLPPVMLVTMEPPSLDPSVVAAADVVVSTVPAEARIRSFADVVGEPAPRLPPDDVDGAVAWRRGDRAAVRFAPAEPSGERRRHLRKYAQGDVQDRAFRFRGPEGRLDLKAQNLQLFVQIGEGVDDETWLYHLRRGDYADWFRRSIKDDELAREAEAAAREHRDDPGASRDAIRSAIDARYTLPG
jgi:HAD superfamily hydrolase (TIGR01484 family)